MAASLPRQTRSYRFPFALALVASISGCLLLGGCLTTPADNSGRSAPPSLVGKWIRSDGLEILKVATDGSVIETTLDLTLGSWDIRATVLCDGKRQQVTGAMNTVTGKLELVIDPYKLTADTDNNVTLTQHAVRCYGNKQAEPFYDVLVGGAGRFTPPSTLTIELIEQPPGTTREWTYHLEP